MNLGDISYILRCKKKWINIQQWYQTQLGQLIFQSEAAIILQQLESCFGYHIVQLGQVSSANVIQSSRIKNKCVLQCFFDQKSEANTTENSSKGAITLFQRLAIKSDSIDVVLLHHCLEFEAFPHEILREVERILVAEGKLIIVFFNPFSLMGLWHFLLRLKSKVRKYNIDFPVETSWISSNRLEDWLALLGFDSQKVGVAFFRPPINNITLLNKLNFMEKIGQRYWPFFSASIVYKATKRVSTLTPLRPKWRLQKSIAVIPVSEVKIPRSLSENGQRSEKNK